MNRQTLKEQYPLMSRAKKFIDKYGIKICWIAEKTDIPKRYLSVFINGKGILNDTHYCALKQFLDEYETRMIGFLAIETD